MLFGVAIFINFHRCIVSIVYQYLFILLIMDICVDSGLGLLYKATKDILIHDFWYHMHAFLGGVYLGLELLGR